MVDRKSIPLDKPNAAYIQMLYLSNSSRNTHPPKKQKQKQTTPNPNPNMILDCNSFKNQRQILKYLINGKYGNFDPNNLLYTNRISDFLMIYSTTLIQYWKQEELINELKTHNNP
jgi:hypothetical protein